MSFIDKFKKKNSIPAAKTVAAVPEKKVVAETEKTVEKTIPVRKGEVVGNAFKVLLSPLVSEKAAVGESLNTYTFKVNKKATKIDIKKAVKQIYGVLPANVRVLNVNAKIVRRGNTRGRRMDWKKAFVTLKKGESINIHEGV